MRPDRSFWIQVSIFVGIAALGAGVLIRGLSLSPEQACQQTCSDPGMNPGDSAPPIRGYIGLLAADLTAVEAVKLGFDAHLRGAIVTQLFSGESADRGGLRVRDVILKVDGAEIAGERELASKIASFPIGQKVVLLVQREHGKVELSVRIEPRPNSAH